MTDQTLDPSPTPDPPIVDPSPAAPPIQVNQESLDEQLARYPAPASDARTLALEPHRYEDATTGPDAQISPLTWVEMTKADGSTFLSPLSNVPYYRRKGFQEGAQQDIPDLVRYWAEKAGEFVTEERTQSTEDAIERLTGVPKTPEQLEEERQALDEEREAKMRAANQPGPTYDNPNENQPIPGPEPGPTPPPEPTPTPEPTPPPPTTP